MFIIIILMANIPVDHKWSGIARLEARHTIKTLIIPSHINDISLPALPPESAQLTISVVLV